LSWQPIPQNQSDYPRNVSIDGDSRGFDRAKYEHDSPEKIPEYKNTDFHLIKEKQNE